MGVDRKVFFERQRRTCEKSILPFIAASRPVVPGTRVLEIGCGEGGVLQAFSDVGCRCVGIERSEGRVTAGKALLAERRTNGAVELISSDIYDVVSDAAFTHSFDVIVMKDVIEHIHDQARLIGALRKLLSPPGVVFLGFPPWTMPFGGHQQVCEHPLLSKLPYVHLLPRETYARVLRWFGEREAKVSHLLEIVDTGISTTRFEAVAGSAGFDVVSRRMYLLSPNYGPRFEKLRLKPIEQLDAISRLPSVRDYVTTAAYYLIAPRNA